MPSLAVAFTNLVSKGGPLSKLHAHESRLGRRYEKAPKVQALLEHQKSCVTRRCSTSVNSHAPVALRLTRCNYVTGRWSCSCRKTSTRLMADAPERSVRTVGF